MGTKQAAIQDSRSADTMSRLVSNSYLLVVESAYDIIPLMKACQSGRGNDEFAQ